MSLVSTYVKASDGKFYKNPVCRDRDWFLCFDDDDPPELVMKVKNRGLYELKMERDQIAAFLDCEVDSSGSDLFSGRCFDIENFRFKNAYSSFLKMKKDLPVIAITEHDGAFKELPPGDMAVYSVSPIDPSEPISFGG